MSYSDSRYERSEEYLNFFDLYSSYVELGEKEGFAGLAEGTGVLLVSLGFVPGEAVILRRLEDGRLQRVDATPGVRAKVRLPAEPVEMTQLPDSIRHPLEEWQVIVKALGHEPSPYNMRLAKILLTTGQLPKDGLTIILTHFQPPNGTEKVPFGVSLSPDWGGVTIKGVHNPTGIPNVPSEGEFISLDKIQEGGKTPLDKAIRTQCKMENAFSRHWADQDLD